jgi:hypothetical protein
VLDIEGNRERRAAKNQALFREINEYIQELDATSSPVTDTNEWICECATDTCVERVSMSQTEYEAIREHGARFFVAPSYEHVWPDVERITEQNDRYWIVEKLDAAGKLAERADPRSDDAPLPLKT